MSVGVFQSLIPFSAKYEYNIDKGQDREILKLPGWSTKALQRRCHLREFLKNKEVLVIEWMEKCVFFRGNESQ